MNTELIDQIQRRLRPIEDPLPEFSLLGKFRLASDDTETNTDAFTDDKTQFSSIKSPVDVRTVDCESLAFTEAADLPLELLDEDEKEKPIETAEDFATRLVSLQDDPNLPVFTFRMIAIGLSITASSAVLNQIFYFRPQAYEASSLLSKSRSLFRQSQVLMNAFSLDTRKALIAAYILGKTWEAVLPSANRGEISAFLNPGHFNIKEHVAIYVMATSGSSAAAVDAFAVEQLFYQRDTGYLIGIFTLLGTQLLGYSLAGLCRSACVYPTYIVFPLMIPTVNVFDMLHRQRHSPFQKKRLRVFWIVLAGIFCWEWVPGYIARTLTGVSIFCLTMRNNRWISRIFGGSNRNEGMGLLSLSLDWASIGSASLATPIQTSLSIYAGVAMCIVLCCTGYALDWWHAQSFPFLSQHLYDSTGLLYRQAPVLNADDSLNRTALAQHGLPWYTWSHALQHTSFHLATGAVISHILLWYSKPIINAIREQRAGIRVDLHHQRMRFYPEVSVWIYVATGVLSLTCILVIAFSANWPLPWYAILAGIGFACVQYPILTLMSSIAGFNIGTGKLAQILCSTLVPGSTRAVLHFNMYSSTVATQALSLTTNLKLGQYTKVCPQTLYFAQVIGTIVSVTCQFVMMQWIMDNNRQPLLTAEGDNYWTGRIPQAVHADAVTWGAFGEVIFDRSRPYILVPVALAIGFAVPWPFWIIHQFKPKWGLDKFLTPAFLWGLGNLAMGNVNSSVLTSFLLAILSQCWLRKYRATWFRKHNYLMAAALDAGTDLMILISTFAVNGGAGTSPIKMPNWALNPSNGNLDCKCYP